MDHLYSLPTASVGIIGGADGPTAIFVTGNWWLLPLTAIAAAALLAGIIVWIKKRKQ